MGDFYVIATPLGNLGDVTLRALETLKRVDTILCEDTRRTSKMLSVFKINKPLLSYHHHSKEGRIEQIISLLEEGKDLAMVSDAGTPGIADPGGSLIEVIRDRFGSAVGIIPIPGPSALTAAASVSGFPIDRFLFLGFPPSKNKRARFFDEVASSKYPVILYESPHRILKTMRDLADRDGERRVMVGKEMTKKFETIYFGTVASVLEELNKKSPKGEFVIILR